MLNKQFVPFPPEKDKMKKAVKTTLVVLLVALVLIQFYRPAKNSGPIDGPVDISVAYNVPADVMNVLNKACYDCHSNHTEYPWYNNIQPVAMWLADHVDEGKSELNFSEFANYKTKRKLKKLKEIVHEVEEGDMPLGSYTWMHSEARLTAQEKQLLIDWAKGLTQKISMEPVQS